MDSLKFTDAAERVLVTFVQALIAFLIANPFDGPGFWDALGLSVVIGVANAAKMLLTLWVPILTGFWADLSYRTVSTFVVGLAGYVAGAAWLDIVSYDFWRSVAYSAGLAALAVIKGGLAKLIAPNALSPASLASAT